MRLDKLLTLSFPFVMLGCHLSPQDVGVISANEAREFAAKEHQLILDYCAPRYKSATKPAEVEDIDKVCLPAEKSYHATKAAWEALVGVLKLAKGGQATDAEVQGAARTLGLAFADLKRVTEVIR